MVPKLRDGLDLRNNYENVVILSSFGIFSKIARNAAETLDAEQRRLERLFIRKPWRHHGYGINLQQRGSVCHNPDPRFMLFVFKRCIKKISRTITLLSFTQL